MKLLNKDNLHNLFEFVFEYTFFGDSKSAVILCRDNDNFNKIVEYFKNSIETTCDDEYIFERFLNDYYKISYKEEDTTYSLYIMTDDDIVNDELYDLVIKI